MPRCVRQLLPQSPAFLQPKGRWMEVQQEELQLFFHLLQSPPINRLLQRDRCFTLADNYLLVTVFIYFRRAGLAWEEYTERNFWLALYLAHDQEEDEEQAKWELLPWALGPQWQAALRSFLAEREELWRRLGHRTLVSRRQCDRVMSLSTAEAWGRVRSGGHGGAALRPHRARAPLPRLPSLSHGGGGRGYGRGGGDGGGGTDRK